LGQILNEFAACDAKGLEAILEWAAISQWPRRDEFDFTLQSTLRAIAARVSNLGPDFVTEGRSLILYGKDRPRQNSSRRGHWLSRHPGMASRPLCITAAKLIEDLSNASAKASYTNPLSAYTHPHVLVVDEIGYLSYGPTLPMFCFPCGE